MSKNREVLKQQAELLEKEIETIFIDSAGGVEDESRFDELYHDLALIEEQLNIVSGDVELLDESFDDLTDEDYHLLSGGIKNEND